jgi:hypothetical protein
MAHRFTSCGLEWRHDVIGGAPPMMSAIGSSFANGRTWAIG